MLDICMLSTQIWVSCPKNYIFFSLQHISSYIYLTVSRGYTALLFTLFKK